MEFVLLGFAQWDKGYPDSEQRVAEVVTTRQEENPDELYDEVKQMVERLGFNHALVMDNFDFGYFVDCEDNNVKRTVFVKVIPAIKVGNKFYELNEIACE